MTLPGQLLASRQFADTYTSGAPNGGHAHSCGTRCCRQRVHRSLQSPRALTLLVHGSALERDHPTDSCEPEATISSKCRKHRDERRALDAPVLKEANRLPALRNEAISDFDILHHQSSDLFERPLPFRSGVRTASPSAVPLLRRDQLCSPHGAPAGHISSSLRPAAAASMRATEHSTEQPGASASDHQRNSA